MNNVIRADFSTCAPVSLGRPARVYSIPHAILELKKRREAFRKANEEKRQRQTRYIIKALECMARHLKAEEDAHASARYAALWSFSQDRRSVAYAIQRGYDELREAMIPLLTDRIWEEGERA